MDLFDKIHWIFKFKHYLFNFDYIESSINLSTRLRRRVCERYVVICGGGNRRFRGKPPTLDGRPLPCHMSTPGFDLESRQQRWQTNALTTALSRPLGILGSA